MNLLIEKFMRFAFIFTIVVLFVGLLDDHYIVFLVIAAKYLWYCYSFR